MAKFFKVVAENRKARFDYHILETFKAGIALSGSEVKSFRLGRVDLRDSFARIEKGEVLLYNMHVSAYEKSRSENLKEKRTRKLLLNKAEIKKITGKTSEKGLVLVPLKVYFEGNWAKVDIALCKPKKKFDKRAKLRKKDIEREVERTMKWK